MSRLSTAVNNADSVRRSYIESRDTDAAHDPHEWAENLAEAITFITDSWEG